MAEKLELEITLKNGQFKAATKDTTKDIKKVEKGVSDAGEKGGKGFKKMSDGASRFGKNIKLLIGLGIAGFFLNVGKNAIKSAARFEKYRVSFETMLGSAKKASKLLKDIQKFSAETPFQLPGLIEVSKQLIAFGVSEDEVIEKLKNLGNAAQGNQKILSRLGFAYGKVKTMGKASMEEIRQFAEAGVPIIQALADSLGITTQQVAKLSSQGKISFNDMDKALTSLTTGQGKFAGMLEKQSRTLSGMWSTLKDNIDLVVLAMGQKMLPGLKNLIRVFGVAGDSGGLFGKVLFGIGVIAGKAANAISVLVAVVSEEAFAKQADQWRRAAEGINEQRKAMIKLGQTTGRNRAKFDLLTKKAQEYAEKGQEAAKKAIEYNNIYNDSRKEFLGIEKEINKTKAEQDKLLAKLAKIEKDKLLAKASQIETAPTEKKEKTEAEKMQEEFELKKTLLQDYADFEMNIGDFKAVRERELENQAADYHGQTLRAKFGMDSKYWAGMATVASTAHVFMAEENKGLFKFGQGLAVAQTAMSTAGAIMKVWEQWGWPLGIIGTGIVGTAGVLQTRKILKQKPPQPPPKKEINIKTALATGTFSVPKTSTGTKDFQLHGGEMVTPRPMADSIRSGEAALVSGESEAVGNTFIVQGNIFGIDGLMEAVNASREQQAMDMGGFDFDLGSVYK